MFNGILRPLTVLSSVSLTLWAFAAHAEDYKFHYVSLSNIALPANISTFEPTAIDERGRVYGAAWDTNFEIPYVAVYEDGALTVRQPA